MLVNFPIDFFHDFIRLGLTRAKALQTVSRFPRETRRRYAALKSNVITRDKIVLLNFVIFFLRTRNLLMVTK
jgi:hypothetical protein